MIVGGLFDGCGLLAYGLHLAGLDHAWLCEKDEFRRGILEQRFPGVPVYDDVRAVGADAPRVTVLAGGFPCKGMSSAGRREGFGHPETALWREQARVIRDLRPRYVLVENVAALLSMQRGECFGEVVGTLAALGYDCEWDCFPAAAFGAPHGRDRVFITAVANSSLGGWGADEPGLRARRREPDSARSGEGDPPLADADSSAVGSGRLGRGAGGAVEGSAPDAAAQGRGEARPLGTRGGEPGRDTAGGGAAASADAHRERRSRKQEGDRADGGVDVEHGDDADGRGADFPWGRYEGAVRRWEALLGRPCPEPLIRRVDDGRTRRVERSRLSALGDGVLVQAGWLCGRRILEHAREADMKQAA